MARRGSDPQYYLSNSIPYLALDSPILHAINRLSPIGIYTLALVLATIRSFTQSP